jgi:hypothetical protein
LEACAPEEFAQRLGLKLATDVNSPVTAAPEAQEKDSKELRPGELWPWLWLLLVVFWFAEGLLANRTVA